MQSYTLKIPTAECSKGIIARVKTTECYVLTNFPKILFKHYKHLGVRGKSFEMEHKLRSNKVLPT